MSILDSLKLRLSSDERQQELARREALLRERKQAAQAREQNIAYREEQAKENPQAVLDAIRADAQRKAEEAEQTKAADKLKRDFGLQSSDLIDTPEMRRALEDSLGQLDVEQEERARQIADRAALLAGLEQLAMIDAARARSILQQYKEATPPRTYLREEIASMFAEAMDRDGGRRYERNLDGWALSIADRERELRRQEAALDMREKALVAKIERQLGIESERTAPSAEQTSGSPIREGARPQSAAVEIHAAPANTPVAGEAGQRLQEERTAEVANSGAPIDATIQKANEHVNESVAQSMTAAGGQSGTSKLGRTREYAIRDLMEDPAKFAETAVEISKLTGKSVAEEARALRESLDYLAQNAPSEKALADHERRKFWEAWANGKQPDMKSAGNGGAELTAGASTNQTAINESSAGDNERKSTGKSSDSLENVKSAAGAATERGKEAGVSIDASIGKAALDVLPKIDAKAAAAIAAAKDAARGTGVSEAQSEGAGKEQRAKRVQGFRSLGRNRSASAAEIDVSNGTEPTATAAASKPSRRAGKASSVAEVSQGESVAASNVVASNDGESTATTKTARAKFRDLTPEQKAERRAEYMKGLRQDAGLTPDGKEVVKEKGREVGKKKGKQVDGVGL
ncbi:hypothetical protein C6Q04_30000 [Burkholderia multivorans]|uniref:hypothetical protein n=1 Tax=Burkholderia cepacia complex TaxID=87882 RepID=UPI00018E3A99|nr:MULTISPECIES: hypothetical protein [Burkholderia cepacia complex]EED97313.1 hypothetical protein BURMUCGD1_6642 [Burkholderia multivorans CGD1]PRF42394.1 hypothetical protein C6Q04_30000 [Burkholderia multivorans]